MSEIDLGIKEKKDGFFSGKRHRPPKTPGLSFTLAELFFVPTRRPRSHRIGAGRTTENLTIEISKMFEDSVSRLQDFDLSRSLSSLYYITHNRLC